MTTTAPRYRTDIAVYGETTWSTNAMRYGTHEEAKAAAENLYGWWMLMKGARVVTEDTPLKEVIDSADPTIVIAP